VLVDGIPVSDPQSGHHVLNVPVPFSAISGVEVLKGGAARMLGPDAFTGAVNLITRLPERSFFSTDLSYGQHSYYDAGISGGVHAGAFSGLADIHHSASAGYRDNTDFAITQVFLRGHYAHKHTSLDILGGWLDKAFGANGFYSPAFPDQYEHYRSGLGGMRFSTGRRLRYEQTAYWRRGRDEFRLFRSDPPAWYQEHNYHRTDVAGTGAKLLIPERRGRTTVGVDCRRESILSTTLGEPTSDTVTVPGTENTWYDHRKNRDVFSFYANQRFVTGRFSVSAGLLLNRTGDYAWKLYGGIDAGYRLSPRWHLFASLDPSLRYPTFTELYYHSPVNVGNPDLLPEKALTAEIGVRKEGKRVTGSAALWYRRGRELIDWVREADTLAWQAMNHTEVNMVGAEFAGVLNIARWKHDPHAWLREVRVSYAFTHADRQRSDYLSKYVLDYLRHQGTLEVRHALPGPGTASWQFILRDRAGEYQEYPSGTIVPYDPYFLTNLRISYHVSVMDLFLDLSNMFNTSYVDIGNLPAPGIWVRGGVKMKLERNDDR
jgi:iron complex outermembrane receptor protein